MPRNQEDGDGVSSTRAESIAVENAKIVGEVACNKPEAQAKGIERYVLSIPLEVTAVPEPGILLLRTKTNGLQGRQFSSACSAGKDAVGSADIGTNHIHISSGTSESLDTGLSLSPPRAKMQGTCHRLAVKGHDHADRSTHRVPCVCRREKRPVCIESRGMVAQGPVRRAETAGGDRRRRGRRKGFARADLLRFSEASGDRIAIFHFGGHADGDSLRPPDLWDSVVEPSSGFRLRRRSSTRVAAWCRDR